MRPMTRLIRLIPLTLLAIALSACHHTLPTIPPAPTQVVDTNLRAAVAKAGGIVLAGSKVVSKASDIELTAFRQGGIPAAIHKQADVVFREIATEEKKIADDIDKGIFTSWPQLRARVDPFIERIRSLVDMLSQAGPSWKDRLLDGLGYALTIFMELQSAGAFGGGL